MLTSLQPQDLPEAELENLSDYIELLYEDKEQKITASTQILTLARNPENLEALLSNNTLLGALARVLREDWKKSTELAANIIYIFFCFSAFKQFHQIIIDYKIGGLCLQVVEYELNKTETWLTELENYKNLDKESSASGGHTNSAENTVYQKYKAKFDTAIVTGDHLLRVALYLLLNIAEDHRIQMKMKQKGINKILIDCLSQPRSDEVQILVVSFLKRLTLFIENVTEMAKLGIVKKIEKLLRFGGFQREIGLKRTQKSPPKNPSEKSKPLLRYSTRRPSVPINATPTKFILPHQPSPRHAR